MWTYTNDLYIGECSVTFFSNVKSPTCLRDVIAGHVPFIAEYMGFKYVYVFEVQGFHFMLKKGEKNGLISKRYIRQV